MKCAILLAVPASSASRSKTRPYSCFLLCNGSAVLCNGCAVLYMTFSDPTAVLFCAVSGSGASGVLATSNAPGRTASVSR